jgi:hypothetical protein
MKAGTFLSTSMALFAGWLSLSADEAHERGQSIKFSGTIEPTADFSERCDFSTEIEPVTFQLTSFRTDYKVVRIRVANRKSEAIALSAEKDGIQLVLRDGSRVKGTFNLREHDGPVWDSLLKDKYRVIRIRVENRTTQPIKLSRDEDIVELILSDHASVRGTFKLREEDGPLWDSLSEDLRNALAYPVSIHGAKGDSANTRRPEVLYLFAFFPAGKVSEIPRSFIYTLQSAGPR